MKCIPAGMEWFPAADEEQFKFIKRVIDDCDYYVLLIAGRYGSTTADGVSYTEREFDYAVERKIPVLVFLHEDPDSIPVGQSDLDPSARAKLKAFREKVMTGRLVKTWSSADDLASKVVLSLTAAKEANPGAGWVRGPVQDVTALLQQVNELRQRNDELERKPLEPGGHRAFSLPRFWADRTPLCAASACGSAT